MVYKSTLNKHHWYDGKFYDTFIAPNQKELFEQIIEFIEPNSCIIDIGCGTGFFSFSVANKCESVLGIDLSKRNLDKANQNLLKKPASGVTFRHNTVENILAEGNQHFDVAILTYVIHEVNDNERIQLLKNIANVADKIIIGDYLIPRPNDMAGKIVRAVEFVAGLDHYRNFRTYEANGGIAYLADKLGMEIIDEIKNHTNHIVILATKSAY